MRQNLPVTDREVFLDARHPIVTRTDRHGRIQYANPEFVRISGFSEAELIGADHNIVRHPDMPRDAFADLWATIGRGQPWQGLVKNRCKDGGYYWVKAYISALYEGGRHVGYMSVRVAPGQSEKQAAERLYAAVNQGAARFPFTPPTRARSLGQWLGLAFLPMALGQGLNLALPRGPFTAAAGITATLVSGGLLYWCARRVGRATDAMQTALARLGEGDFTQAVTAQGTLECHRLLTSLETTRVNLRALISDVVMVSHAVSDSSTHVGEEASHVYEQNGQISEGVAQIAASLEQLSVSIQEISATTRDGARHAEEARQLVESGRQHMDASRLAIEQVVGEVERTRLSVRELERISGQIGSITEVIQSIAEQTNLLALNAAIEAARAGEEGRGFSVVADEVRKLAEHTANNTVDIRSSIGALQHKIRQIIDGGEVMADCVRSVEEHIQETADSLLAVRDASLGVAEVTTAIADTLTQQSSASTDVAQTMEALRNASERNNDSVEQSRAIARRLNGFSTALQALLKNFERHL